MRSLFIVVALLIACSLASLPKSQTLRFKEVTGNTLGENSVDDIALQDFVVDTENVKNKAITAAKIAPLTINAEQITPNAVTTKALALDVVQLFIKDTQTVPAQSQNLQVTIPEDVRAIWPYENTLRTTSADQNAIVDNPAVATSYRIEGKARGPGTILGWYPTRNGHLLRYQSSRALRGLTCDSLSIANATPNTQDGVDDTHSHGFITTFTCGTTCTTIDCGDPVTADPHCANIRGDQADRCSPYTSVADTTNPQEGVPVYSPTVERLTISPEGLVELWYFGAGTAEFGGDNSVDISVVVLLDDQYGSGLVP